MNMVSAVCVFLLMVSQASASTDGPNPLSQVISLLDDLAAKVTKEGAAEKKSYEEYMDFCTNKARTLGFSIQTATTEQEELEATIAKKATDIEASASKIESLAGDVSTDESELSEATGVREKEAKDFAASEAELVDTIGMLGRAIVIVQKEMAKSPASFSQLSSTKMDHLVSTLGTIIDAASFSTSDKQKLTALVQSHASDSDVDEDGMSGAPAAAAYQSHSSSIVEVLEDLKEKAEEELAKLRKSEANAAHNYALLKQSLEDEMAADTKDMAGEKAAKAAAQEAKASAEGDLAETVKGLEADKKALAESKTTCATIEEDHKASVKGTAEELAAIAEAKTVLTEMTGAAETQEYSFLQHKSEGQSTLHTRTDLANAEVVNLLKKLAREQHSKSLAQLASRVSAVIRFGVSAGEDPFAKVKGLITDMIAKLQAEAGAEATEKAYCDENAAKTATKKEELNSDISKLTVKIKKAASASEKLKTEVKDLQAELAALAKEQAEMNTIRGEQTAAFAQAKADYTTGLDGVRKAMSVLSDYYGSAASASFLDMMKQAPPVYHKKSTDAGKSIIELLEVVESDFAKSLTEAESEEAEQASIYEKTTQENKIIKGIKEQDVKYKTQEFKGLDKTIAELTSDRTSVSDELSAVLEFETKLTERCVAKPETYEGRKARREAEIAGLKEALSILENETAFTQRRKRGFKGRGHFLGVA